MLVRGLSKVVNVFVPTGEIPLEMVFTCDVLPPGTGTGAGAGGRSSTLLHALRVRVAANRPDGPVLQLVPDASGRITGQTIVVDDGATII